MLRIKMLAARNGDSLVVEYGDEGRPHRLLVDGGPKASYQEGLRAFISGLPEGERHFELMIVAHIDTDHIDGCLSLLNEPTLGATFSDIWFNGYRHLPDPPLESLGPIEGELLTIAILGQGLSWNANFGGNAVVCGAGVLPRKELADGLVATLLSPLPEQLAALKVVWREVVTAAGLDPTRPAAVQPTEASGGLEALGVAAATDVDALASEPFHSDSAEANGSSIVVLLEYEGSSVLLGADAFPGVIAGSSERLAGERGVEDRSLRTEDASSRIT